MADSNAVRSRRKRKHAAGDHSMCRHAPEARITLARPPQPAALDARAGRGPGVAGDAACRGGGRACGGRSDG